MADHAVARHYPEAREAADQYRAFLRRGGRSLGSAYCAVDARGIHPWLLNTDNTSIAGETIDYGPCAFMDTYHPDKVFSSIDQFGRYAIANQPAMIKWNLARFAETLLPLIADGADKAVEAANESIERFDGHYHTAYLAGLRQKLGLMLGMEGDEELGADLLTRMAENKADFTLTFRALRETAGDPGRDAQAKGAFFRPGGFRPLGGALARTPLSGASITRRTQDQHACGQSDVHSAKPSC